MPAGSRGAGHCPWVIYVARRFADAGGFQSGQVAGEPAGGAPCGRKSEGETGVKPEDKRIIEVPARRVDPLNVCGEMPPRSQFPAVIKLDTPFIFEVDERADGILEIIAEIVIEGAEAVCIPGPAGEQPFSGDAADDGRLDGIGIAVGDGCFEIEPERAAVTAIEGVADLQRCIP